MMTIRRQRGVDPGRLFGCRPRRTVALRWVGDERENAQTGQGGDERVNDGCADARPDSNERSDGGTPDSTDSDERFTMYTDEEYGYRVAYPTEWSVETEPTGGASFGALAPSDAGAVVFVDEPVESLQSYVEEFMTDLRADEHVHVSEPVTQRDVCLKGGHRGQVIECPYVGDTPTKTLRFVYLLAVVGGTGYTVGVDWNDDDSLDDVATHVVESFAVDERTERVNENREKRC